MAAVLLAVAGCGTSDSGGSAKGAGDTLKTETATDLLGPEKKATGEPVKIGLVSDGATSAFDNTDELRAGEATAAFWNEHRGGIAGRPVELITCSTGGTPDGVRNCANEMIQKDALVVAQSQSILTGQLWDALHPAGVPTWFTQAQGDQMEVDKQSTFIVFNPQAVFFGLPVAVAEANKVKKISFVVIDVPQAVEIITNGGGDLLKKAGYDYDVVRVPIGTADMTAQMQQVATSGAGVVQVIGNDAFCISAFQGLKAVSYTGSITAISQCITNATREAMPGGLQGINVMSTLALGVPDDQTYQLYQAVMTKYGSKVTDVNNLTSLGGYGAVASLLTALQGLPAGSVTRDAAVQAIRAMPKSPYPGGGGMTYQCNGQADPPKPPVCTNQWLRTELDANGLPTTYTVEDSTSLLTTG